MHQAADVSECTEGFTSGCPSGREPALQKTLLLDFLRDGPAVGFATDNYEAVVAVGETVILLHPPSTFSRSFNRDRKGCVSNMTELSPTARRLRSARGWRTVGSC